MMPPVVKNLLIINAIMFVATYFITPQLGAFIMEWLALWPVNVPQPLIDYIQVRGGLANVFYPWQLFSSAFLHGGFGHIFFNMFGLWIFGMRLENVWGSKRFAYFFFFCVIGASLIQLLVTSWPFLFGSLPYPQPIPTVGASGGVYGILLAFAMMYPNERIYLYFIMPIKAKYFIAGLAVFGLFAGITGTQAGVAHFAHLGGMLFGFILIQYWRGKLPMKAKEWRGER